MTFNQKLPSILRQGMKKVACNQEKKETIESALNVIHILELADKNFKITMINIILKV